jgi:uncharacterized protein (TIGR03435 family)
MAMKKTLLAAVGVFSVAAPFMTGLVGAPCRAQSQSQQQPAALSFDVASVKPNKSMSQDMGLNPTPGGGLTVVNATLQTLMTFAYNIRDYQLSGGPAWLDTEHYDISAKASSDLRDDDSSGYYPVRIRLQTLLAERFHLVVHHETKEMPVFALVQDKGGAKLTPWMEGDLPGPHMHLEYTKLTCRKQSMQRFASAILSQILGRTVIDKTGLTGEYNFTMTFAPDTPPSRSANAAPEAPAGPTFVEALQDQLGLKLERQQGPVDILVIDHAERADPN